jgi:hypothetical protein
MASDDQPAESDLVDTLVTRWHLNVPERAMLPNRRARGSLVKAAISAHLRADGWFPRDWRPDHDLAGGVMERTETGCRIHWKAECGVNRFALVRVTKHSDLLDAAQEWVRGMFGEDIDGVAIDWKL